MTTTLIVPAGQRWGCGDTVVTDGRLWVVEGVEFGVTIDGFGMDTLTVHRATRLERMRARGKKARLWWKYRRPLWTYWPPWGD